jgi:hypothetical protein
MRTIRGEDGRTHVSADLRWCERWWSARSLLLLQRLRCTVPSIVPVADDICASLHRVTTSESGEAVSGRAWSVLEEDRVLGVGAEVRHVPAEIERGDESVRLIDGRLASEKSTRVKRLNGANERE